MISSLADLARSKSPPHSSAKQAKLSPFAFACQERAQSPIIEPPSEQRQILHVFRSTPKASFPSRRRRFSPTAPSTRPAQAWRSKSHSLPVATALGGGGVAAPFQAPMTDPAPKSRRPPSTSLWSRAGERSAKGPAPGRLRPSDRRLRRANGARQSRPGDSVPGEKPERDLHVALRLHRAAHNAEGR